MKLWSGHYLNSNCQTSLTTAFIKYLPAPDQLRIICIGTGDNIPDCWGPMCGSLLETALPDLEIQGTLTAHWHAVNHHQRLRQLRLTTQINFVIDAGCGSEPLGTLILQCGLLYPGRASGKILRPLGDINLIAVTAHKRKSLWRTREQALERQQLLRLARLVEQALIDWKQAKENTSA